MAISNQRRQLFFLFALLLPIAIKGSDFIAQQCGKNFTGNDALQGSIKSAIDSLVANTSSQGFARSTTGADSNTVYGISECRGDITGQACSSCIVGASQQVSAACPNSAEVLVWFQTCFLRIDIVNFIGQPDTTKVGVWSGGSPADEPAFTRTVDELMIVVGMAAVYGENRKFGWGKIENNHIAEKVVYGMLQCTWDLADTGCTKCLGDALKYRSESCQNRTGCFVITNSCSMRYEVSQFLFTGAPLDPATPTRSLSVANL